MRKQTKIAALVSAAALLAIGASMTSFAAGWKETSTGVWQYLDNYGDPVTDEWHVYQGYYLYLDSDGYVARDKIISYGDDLYYVNANGARQADVWVSRPNDEGIQVGDIEPANLYYYFKATTGKAAKGGAVGNIRRSNSDATTCKFVFDDDGHMMSGWQTLIDSNGKSNTYFCSGEDEGYVLTGWQYLDKPLEDVWEDPYDYDDKAWYHFGTDGIMKTGRNWLEWEGKYSYYVFGTNGQLLESGWSPLSVATSPTASPSQLQAYYVDGGARAKGWVEADYDGTGSAHSTTWFYVDSTGVPFNYNHKDSTGASVQSMTDNKVYNDVAARIIEGKTYLFNEYGEYMTGIYKVLADVKRVGSTKELEADAIYYFSETSGDPKGSMVTKKVQKSTDDIVDNYYFKSSGQAAASEIAGGVLYATDGKRVDATDSAWQVVDLSDFAAIPGKSIASDKKDSAGKPVTLTGVKVIVNANGRVKESGTVTIDGIKYYIKTAPSKPSDTYTSEPSAANYKSASYVVVGEDYVS